MQHFLTATASGRLIHSHLTSLPPKEAFCLLCLVAIGQEHVLHVLPVNGALAEGITSLCSSLTQVEEFYDSIGGLAGYQLQCLQLIEQHAHGGATSSVEDATGIDSDVEFLVPTGLNLSSSADASAAAAATVRGLLGLPQMAEIYPLGGAGDRLGLCCEETGESLPTAVLPYCGRSLLGVLLRDLQAREYLYFKVYRKQLTTPVAVMTSSVKGNHWRVQQLFEQADWFGRGEDAFRLFPQPLVPVVAAADGRWLLNAPLEPVMKPGGHGVIWKLMLDSGVFDWLARTARTAAIVRQISNPMAGQDTTLLALAGEGLRGDHAFGFASCERVVGAAEGMNVLLKQLIDGGGDEEKPRASFSSSSEETTGREEGTTKSRYSYRVTNVEYTEFSRLGIEDKGASEGSEHSAFPANTNVLFLGLSKIEAKVRQGIAAGTTEAILPGMILNVKKETTHRNLESGKEERSRAGRLECTMQNLADCFVTEAEGDSIPAPLSLDTFMVYGPRRKVTSSAKRQRSPGSIKIHQTPDGSLYDLQQNAAEMLSLGGVEMPPLGSVPEYLDNGPGFLFFFHPALGPLWSVVAQKIRGGRFAARSEVQLEIAEADVEGLDVDGSFLVVADDVLGYSHLTSSEHTSNTKRLVYSDTRCGRIHLRNVRVRNAGVDWEHPSNVYWRHRVARKESCQVLLRGCSEFEAEDVELRGNVVYEVPDGYKMRVSTSTSSNSSSASEGEVCVELTPLKNGEGSWRWEYSADGGDGEVNLEKKRAC